jgi:hypothetical protein
MKDISLTQNVEKTWIKPELIILMRSHPEETVLQTDCKTPGISGPNDQTCAAGNAPNPQCFSSNNPS